MLVVATLLVQNNKLSYLSMLVAASLDYDLLL